MPLTVEQDAGRRAHWYLHEAVELLIRAQAAMIEADFGAEIRGDLADAVTEVQRIRDLSA